ncbi:MAG: hypothetical protein OQK71_06940 [Desulfobacter sp.]|nr:hypothetical protein [Desulfobacter sp.]
MPNDIIQTIPLILRVNAPLQNNQRIVQYNLAVFLKYGDINAVVFTVYGSYKITDCGGCQLRIK